MFEIQVNTKIGYGYFGKPAETAVIFVLPANRIIMAYEIIASACLLIAGLAMLHLVTAGDLFIAAYTMTGLFVGRFFLFWSLLKLSTSERHAANVSRASPRFQTEHSLFFFSCATVANGLSRVNDLPFSLQSILGVVFFVFLAIAVAPRFTK